MQRLVAQSEDAPQALPTAHFAGQAPPHLGLRVVRVASLVARQRLQLDRAADLLHRSRVDSLDESLQPRATGCGEARSHEEDGNPRQLLQEATERGEEPVVVGVDLVKDHRLVRQAKEPHEKVAGQQHREQRLIDGGFSVKATYLEGDIFKQLFAYLSMIFL